MTTGDPLPPFSCEQASAGSPLLDGVVVFDPAQPHPGDTLTVVVRATNGTSRQDAPPMDLEVTDRSGVRTVASQTIEGGEAVYYYSIPQVPEGELCLRGLVAGANEVSGKLTVTPRPPGPPIDGGIFKIVANHMWTCDEQPSFGNELHVWVRDENGQAMSGVPVAVRPADTTDLRSIYNGDAQPLPSEIVTGDDGHAMAFNYWPISDNGLLVFEVEVAGVASDIATEITTGWWEDDLMGCNYCNTATVNTWGHWSYTVEFQRDPSANEVCVVDNDHAGMTACGEPRHVHHAPGVQACWAP
ncbi:MAG: hypothetical protein K0V04_42355 [Deltaproteobacteria bacterium]|nr:hypothetical protein [Deltaproteobacteria bacterium]